MSGAGPTVVALTLEGAVDSVAQALEAAYRRLGIEAHAHPARVDHQGARVLS
jgi:homoserine kinase